MGRSDRGRVGASLWLLGFMQSRSGDKRSDKRFVLRSSFQPAGDQPSAIASLTENLARGERNQVLLGVTGSGKTFTVAHVIARLNRPSLILAPNKTLAAQLYMEMRGFFPENAVEYFVSYYDYYQPEAYVPRSDTYIEKESCINAQIDRLRHSATRSLLERRDVIIVASISCIYGIGDPEIYSGMRKRIRRGDVWVREALLGLLVELQYRRNDIDFQRGSFRVCGDAVDIFPAHYADRAWRVGFFGNEVESISEIDSLTGEVGCSLDEILIFANSHYVTPRPTLQQAIKQMRGDLRTRLAELRGEGKLLEAERLEQRTLFDLESLHSTGTCPGIENYSRYLTGRSVGCPPPTLFEYFPQDSLLFVDESHVTIGQLHGMYNGDFRRKKTLVSYGFRLPVAMDNRPLQFSEWQSLRPQTVFVSATPGSWELEQVGGVFVDQVIRPTGLMDPVCEVRPAEHQVDDLMSACRDVIGRGHRVLVTALTKRMAEDLTEYLNNSGLRANYLHSDIDTLERIEILQDLRRGSFDILVGINLLREGLDIPECGLVAILDADKEGFLRSETSLIQTIGRAARNADGCALLYADGETRSIQAALRETSRRREKQAAYNRLHGITPLSIKKGISSILESVYEKDRSLVSVEGRGKALSSRERKQRMADLERRMLSAAADLEFEEAARLRDALQTLETGDLLVGTQLHVSSEDRVSDRSSGRSSATERISARRKGKVMKGTKTARIFARRRQGRP